MYENDINKANESIAKALEVKGRGNTTPTCQDNVVTPNAAVNFIHARHKYCKHKCTKYK